MHEVVRNTRYVRTGKTRCVLSSISQTLSGLTLMQPTCFPAGSSSNILRRRGPICCCGRGGTPSSYIHAPRCCSVITLATVQMPGIRVAIATGLHSITSGNRAAAAAINFPADSARCCQHPIAAMAMAGLPICSRGAYRGD
jgi:hypothetical protein